MTPFQGKPVVVVASFAGERTGETILRDSNGRYWTNENTHWNRTGERHATLYPNGTLKYR